MRISEIIGKAIDIISAKPIILVPTLIPAILQIIRDALEIGWTYSVLDYWAQFSDADWDAMDPGQITDIWRGFAPQFAVAEIADTIVGLVIWILGVIAFSMVISMAAAHFEGKEMTLSEAFNSISGKLLLLIVVSAIVWGGKLVGICALCIGALLVWVLLSLVRQGVIVDSLDLGATLSKSYEIAKNNFFDVLLILGLFFVVKIVFALIPVVGDGLGYLVDAFSVCAMTILYFDRR